LQKRIKYIDIDTYSILLCGACSKHQTKCSCVETTCAFSKLWNNNYKNRWNFNSFNFFKVLTSIHFGHLWMIL